MAILNVNPTRMELQSLKAKLDTARRGHKLLKDKCDEIIRQFMILVRENKKLRLELEEEIKEAQKYMAASRGALDPATIDTALLLPKLSLSVTETSKNIMSVKIPHFDIESNTSESGSFSYGFAFTSSDLDDAVKRITDLMPRLIKLAEIEKSCQLLADEAEKTRRRVNALEYVMIPDYEETIKYVMMKLEENERSTTVRLMKVKDLMLSAD